jgi:hypothetical protein
MTQMPESAFPRGRNLPLVLFATVLALAAFANAAAYIAYAANPLVASDSWYFIDAFLRKAMETGLSLQDFFVKRDATDHAQPLVKALLLFDAKWWGLDFVYEALVGLAFAAATFLVLAATTWRGARERQPRWLHGLALGALAACLVTLNSGMVFNWSLVTLIYMSYFLVVAGAAVSWRSLQTGRFLALFLVSLLIAFSFDDVGLIMAAAKVIATMFAAARLGRLRVGIIASAVIVSAEICYLVASRVLLDPHAPGVVPAGGIMANVQPLWALRDEWPAIARIVLGSTFAHINPLSHYLSESAASWQGVLAILAALGHAWFWWRAWRTPWNLAVFYAVAIMLLFYGMVAGILYGRISVNGIPYLNEPRYVAIYLLGTVALVLMVLGQPGGAAKARLRACSGVALALLLALQVPLSKFTWYEGRFLGAYYHEMAHEMIQLGDGTVPDSCVPMLTICNVPEAERQSSIEFLSRHRLNVYSDEFLQRYRLEKLKAPAGGTDR